MHSGHGKGRGINENSARLRNPRKFVWTTGDTLCSVVVASTGSNRKGGQEISLGFSYLSKFKPPPYGKQMFPTPRLGPDDNDGRGILSSGRFHPGIVRKIFDEGYRESKGKIFISLLFRFDPDSDPDVSLINEGIQGGEEAEMDFSPSSRV